MGFLEEVHAFASEKRTIGGVPWMPWKNANWRFDTGGPVHWTQAFMGVEAALGLPALYAGAKLLADNAASLELRIYNDYVDSLGDLKKRRYLGPSIFDQPSLTGTTFDWIFQCMASLILQGNAWGYITHKDGYGYPLGIEWIPPEDVFVQEIESAQTWDIRKARVYIYGREVRWYGPDAEVFHIKAFALPGKVEGISLLKAFALTIMAGKEAQRYGTDWYATGGFPPGTFQNSEIEIDAQQSAEIRAELVKSLRRREPLVYGRDWDYKPVTVPPNEAQFIEAMQLNATHIASLLSLPPDRVGGTRGDSLTYSTVEQSTLQVIEALRPWLVRLEQSFFKILPQKRRAKFYTDSLLKTDLLTRMQIYQIRRNIGVMTADEIRDEMDFNALPNGIGAEGLPQELMVAMGTRAGAIPKSLMKSVILEMDVATDRLIKLEKSYIATGKLPAYNPAAGGAGGDGAPPSASPNPGAGGNFTGSGTAAQPVTGPVPPPGTAPIGRPNAPLPLAQDPASFLASLIGVQRDMSLPFEVRHEAQQMVTSIMDRWDQIKAAEPEIDNPVPGSHLYAPWGRNPEDAVKDSEGWNRRT